MDWEMKREGDVRGGGRLRQRGEREDKDKIERQMKR